jgi:hypothetical protein
MFIEICDCLISSDGISKIEKDETFNSPKIIITKNLVNEAYHFNSKAERDYSYEKIKQQLIEE